MMARRASEEGIEPRARSQAKRPDADRMAAEPVRRAKHRFVGHIIADRDRPSAGEDRLREKCLDGVTLVGGGRRISITILPCWMVQFGPARLSARSINGSSSTCLAGASR